MLYLTEIYFIVKRKGILLNLNYWKIYYILISMYFFNMWASILIRKWSNWIILMLIINWFLLLQALHVLAHILWFTNNFYYVVLLVMFIQNEQHSSWSLEVIYVCMYLHSYLKKTMHNSTALFGLCWSKRLRTPDLDAAIIHVFLGFLHWLGSCFHIQVIVLNRNWK